jgi:glycine cleavage system H protein
VKAVSELYCPLSGEVVAVNERLDGEPSLVNSDPYGDGWMIRLKLKDAGEKDSLMSAEAYTAHIGG